MRLLKRLFQPVHSMTADEVRDFIRQHDKADYTLLDVRQPGEYETSHIPGATLIPLPRLKRAVSELDPQKPTIVYCAIGGRSQVAARMLNSRGFREVYNMKGGISAWKDPTAIGPRDLHLDFITGDESPAEIIAIAYEMEDGQQQFYLKCIARSSDPDVQSMMQKLADIESGHKTRLLNDYNRLNPNNRDHIRLNTELMPKLMEGGFSMDEFMKANASFMNSLSGLLDMAMMLEAQSMDLYSRFAQICKSEQTRQLLFSIASDEQAHLNDLGALFEEKL